MQIELLLHKQTLIFECRIYVSMYHNDEYVYIIYIVITHHIMLQMYLYPISAIINILRTLIVMARNITHATWHTYLLATKGTVSVHK